MIVVTGNEGTPEFVCATTIADALEQLWPELARLHGERIALEAPHAKPPQRLSYRELHDAIERAGAAFTALGLPEASVA